MLRIFTGYIQSIWKKKIIEMKDSKYHNIYDIWEKNMNILNAYSQNVYNIHKIWKIIREHLRI